MTQAPRPATQVAPPSPPSVPAAQPASSQPTSTSAATLAVVPAEKAQPSTVATTRTPRSERPTPAVLRALRTLTVLMTVVLALTAGAIMLQTRHAMTQGAADTEQYTRVHDAQSHLLSAHALASQDFLQQVSSRGTSSAEAFRGELAKAQELIMTSASEQPADRVVLQKAATAVLSYTERAQSARDANRQGLTVGTAQLAEAHRVLTDEALPSLRAASDANAERIASNATILSPWWLLGVGLLTVATLVLASYVLARRTHRVLNIGLVLSTLLALGAMYLGAQTMTVVNTDLRQMRDSNLATITQVASARSDAARAKANESLALVYRSSDSGQYERGWSTDSYHVRKALATIPRDDDRTALTASFQQYVKAHRAIRDEVMGGSYDKAVQLASASGAGSANQAYADFTKAATEIVARHSQAAASTQRNLSSKLLTMAPICMLLALAAMSTATLGLNRRLREFQ